MIRDLKSLLPKSPPQGVRKTAAQQTADKASPGGDSPLIQDHSDVRLDSPDATAAAAPKPKKQGFKAILGAIGMLGLTGLGIFMGSGNPTPVQAPKIESVQAKTSGSEQTATELLTQMDVTPQMLVAGRQGQLLGAGKILKFDQFPGLHREHLSETIPGAPNFRQVEGTDVYGVAQPTIEGLRGVLERTGAKDKPVVWTNMREEPVVYINGRSHSLRSEAHPFENSADFQGSSGESVEQTEERLKAEILAEAKANGGKILLHGEDANGVISEWVEVTPESVKTPREVYQDFQAEGYQVDFARVPVTDEKTPEAQDLQALVQRVTSAKEGSSFIFNCHAGRGRTTTAMVAAQLIQRAQNPELADQAFHRMDAIREDIKEQGHYDTGNYRVILGLIKKIDNGLNTKLETDSVIDQTEDIQNLRTDINKNRKASLSAESESSAQRAKHRGLDYLHRYHTLISFNQYAKEQAPEGFKLTFEEWLESKPEITQLLENMELAMRAPQVTPGQAPTSHYA